MEPIRLGIEDMASAGSLELVANALRMVPGVISVRPVPGAQEFRVEAAENVDPDELVAAAQKAGCIASVIG